MLWSRFKTWQKQKKNIGRGWTWWVSLHSKGHRAAGDFLFPTAGKRSSGQVACFSHHPGPSASFDATSWGGLQKGGVARLELCVATMPCNRCFCALLLKGWEVWWSFSSLSFYQVSTVIVKKYILIESLCVHDAALATLNKTKYWKHCILIFSTLFQFLIKDEMTSV